MDMRKIVILILILMMIIAGSIFLWWSSQGITGKTVEEFQYSYTKAICNESNFCQDYQIVCKNNEVISQTPITGAVLQQASDWKDPRDEERINGFCNVSLKV